MGLFIFTNPISKKYNITLIYPIFSIPMLKLLKTSICIIRSQGRSLVLFDFSERPLLN